MLIIDVTSYFLKNCALKELFEEQHNDLATHAEQLHEKIYSNTLEELFRHKSEIKRRAAKLKASVEFFAENEEIEKLLQHKADSISQSWACTSCSHLHGKTQQYLNL